MIQPTIDPETKALAQCYALLIRKARERRERLAAQEAAAVTAVESDVKIEMDETGTKKASK